MCNPFEITLLHITPEELYVKLQAVAAEHPEVTVHGDATSGTVSATGAALTYYATDQTYTVQVIHKPFFVTCGYAEEKIREFIAQYDV